MAERPSRRITTDASLMWFRIHFVDGTTMDVLSASAKAVREEHKAVGAIDKVKIIREKIHG